jgi:hypothetical protein
MRLRVPRPVLKKPQRIHDEKGHHDQANQIEDAIHTMPCGSARHLMQPTERPHEQENGNGNTTSHLSLL